MEKSLEQLEAEEAACWERVKQSKEVYELASVAWGAACKRVTQAKEIPKSKEILERAGYIITAPRQMSEVRGAL